MSIIAYVPRAALPAALPQRGLLLDPSQRHLPSLRDALRWAERAPLELDPTNKQLIPYVVLRCADHVWTMRRTRAQSEARLHDRLSIGVGGHLELVDDAQPDPIASGLLRELDEEIISPHQPELTFMGLINDDSTEVGQVHLGLLYVAELPSKSGVAVRETDKHIGQWLTLAALHEQRDALETWSLIALEALTPR